MDQFGACWEGLEDPRTGNASLHDFHELLMVPLCTVLCGGQGAVDMALFATAKEQFLRGFLKVEIGVPSYDTFSRLLRLLDPAQFGAVFKGFIERFSNNIRGAVAIDGKVLRRAFDRASGNSALHMVSAWPDRKLPINQPPHNLALGDADADRLQLGHQPFHGNLALVTLHQHAVAQFRPEMATGSGGQRRQMVSPVGVSQRSRRQRTTRTVITRT